MSEPLQHLQLIVHHLLVSLDVLLQNDLNGDLSLGRFGFSDNTIGAGTQGFAKPVLGSVIFCISPCPLYGCLRWRGTDFFS